MRELPQIVNEEEIMSTKKHVNATRDFAQKSRIDNCTTPWGRALREMRIAENVSLDICSQISGVSTATWSAAERHGTSKVVAKYFGHLAFAVEAGEIARLKQQKFDGRQQELDAKAPQTPIGLDGQPLTGPPLTVAPAGALAALLATPRAQAPAQEGLVPHSLATPPTYQPLRQIVREELRDLLAEFKGGK